MKKKLLALVLAVALIFMYGCGTEQNSNSVKKSKKSTRTEQRKKSTSKKKSDTSKKKSESGENDPDDPANNDPTADTSKKNTTSQMEKKYIGTWEQQGLLMSDGSLDNSDGSTGTIVIKSDGTYRVNIKDMNGKATKESGKWSLNSKKKVVLGSLIMGINDDGYLLRYSGERDGKGFRLYYAFKKK